MLSSSNGSRWRRFESGSSDGRLSRAVCCWGRTRGSVWKGRRSFPGGRVATGGPLIRISKGVRYWICVGEGGACWFLRFSKEWTRRRVGRGWPLRWRRGRFRNMSRIRIVVGCWRGRFADRGPVRGAAVSTGGFQVTAVNLPLDRRPVVVAIAGSKGAGRTTFYRRYLRAAGLRLVSSLAICLMTRMLPRGWPILRGAN